MIRDVPSTMSFMAVRSETSRRAVLQATMDLLGDEPPGPVSLQKLSIEGIARRAGVSKMTIYRWWPDKVALVWPRYSAITRSPVLIVTSTRDWRPRAWRTTASATSSSPARAGVR